MVRREDFAAVGKVLLAQVGLVDFKVICAEEGCAAVRSRIRAGSVRNARPEDDNVPYNAQLVVSRKGGMDRATRDN